MNRLNRVCRINCLACAVGVVWLSVGSQGVAQEPPIPQPPKENEILKKDVGTWDATSKIWTQPDAEPTVSTGVETNELIGNGMWLVSRFEGSMMGMPFAGVGTSGYDPVEKKYVGTWVDSMSPHILTTKGDYDAATKTMTIMATGRDPATGQPMTSKLISRTIDDNTRTFEFQAPVENGQFQKIMEIEYKRRAQ